MLEEHAKLMLLLEKAGRIAGRKKLQKIIYISKRLQFDFKEKFQFHFYGPYSEELSVRVEELTNLGLVTEDREDKGHYTQYIYRLADKGREYLQAYPTRMEEQSDGLQQLVQQLNQRNSRFLELVSTMFYFDELEKSDLIKKVQQVKEKQNYTENELEEAFHYIQELHKLY